MSLIQEIRQAVIDGQAKVVVPKVEQALAEGLAPDKILHEGLIDAMSEVGRMFEEGEYFVPEMLIAARAMSAALELLKPRLVEKGVEPIGKVAIGTVKGDLHDIGKNLVKTIVSNNGFEVVDLGKQAPAETIIQAAQEQHATAIGLSALLVSTSKQMPLIVNELHRRKLNFPVLIGGAAINPRFGWRIFKCEDGEYYAPGVFYCKDAFEGLAVMDTLTDAQRYQASLDDLRRKAEHEYAAAQARPEKSVKPGVARSVPPAEKVPEVKQWGVRVVKEMPLPLVAKHLNLNELYRLSWGAKNAHGSEWKRLQVEFDLRREAMLRSAEKEGWLKPQGVYGYWPVLADDDTLVVYDPQTLTEKQPSELERFEFPRQVGGEDLCLADYFLPVGSGRFDVVAFQIVTVGDAAGKRFAELEAVHDYSEAYFTHGLAVQMAEAAADYLHAHIRRELGLKDAQGLRYSWGYPAIPELSDHSKVFRLLPAESALGMQLTSAYQLVPEQSTAAIIVHHPLAKYFNIGVNRVEQLLG